MIDPRFVNADGFVTVQPNADAIPGEGNGWLQTGLAVATGQLTTDRIADMIWACHKGPQCPLVFRSPHKRNPDDSETADDYWGALPLNQMWALEIYIYGCTHKWLMDVQEQGRLAFWFGRFLGFAPFVKLCAGLPTNWLDRTILNTMIYLDSYFISHSDGNMIAFCRASAAAKRDPRFAKAFAFWQKRVLAKYGTLGASWAAYFGPGHPLNEV
jgi:hypothetical protein